ncbi:MAG: hypothetical protein K2Y32_23205 [Candidatus Obscuribacterales bacterium]|nr:hypothetical protein [Candidatus Obscuribacterales bacterium]
MTDEMSQDKQDGSTNDSNLKGKPNETRPKDIAKDKNKNRYNGGITQELKAIKFDPDASQEKKALVEQIEIMRAQSKAIGSDTSVIDEFAKEELFDSTKKVEDDKKNS